MMILFVDNHPEFTSVVVAAFLAGHDVTVVPTIAAAREALQGADFDVALVDYDLDDGKGVELVRWVRSIDRRIALVAVSARPEGNEALLAAGADAACAKIEFARIGAVLAELPP